MIAPNTRLEKSLIFVLGQVERTAQKELIIREAGSPRLDLKGKQAFNRLLEEGFAPTEGELCVAAAFLRIKDKPASPRSTIPMFAC